MNNQQMTIFLLEILYYSLFLKLSKRKLNFVKVFIIYLLANICLYFIGFQSFYAYALYVAIIFILSRILGLSILMYDVLVILISLLFKLLLEIPLYIILGNNINLFVSVFIMGIYKCATLLLIRNKLSYLYNKYRIKWDNNDFYIRYSFSTFLYTYIIMSILYILNIVR